MNPNNKYTKMQQSEYDKFASEWSLENKDPVVGSFDKHNAWADYDNYLFKNIEDTQSKVALDFGCGPGRNIVKFSSRFQRIDGVDISSTNLDNAALWCKENNVSTPTLYKNNGVDLADISSDTYDIVFSTITLQHICVHEIRLSLFKEFHRVLKPGGSICIQMGFGPGHPTAQDYYANFYDAPGTNSRQDTRIDNTDQVKSDLESIGYSSFEFDLRPMGPGCGHSQWIFFRAKK